MRGLTSPPEMPIGDVESSSTIFFRLILIPLSADSSLKLVSSLTLFGSVAKGVAAAGLADAGELARVADSLLQAARAEGYRPCAFTLARLRASDPLPFDGAVR